MTEKSQRLLRLNYNVYVGSENSSFDVYSNRFDGNTRRRLKKHLKKRIGDYIGKRIGSIGNSYLLSEQTPDKSTNKGFLLGENGGKICKNSSEQYVYDLIILTVVDSGDADKIEKIYNKVLKELDNQKFAFDMGIIFDNLSSSKTREFVTRATEPQPPYKKDRYSSHDDESLTSSIPESEYKDVDIVEQISAEGSVTDPLQSTENVDDADEMLKKYDVDSQVESLKQDYNEEAVEVRKPTDNEVEKIVESIIERFEQMSKEGDAVYFEKTPEFWDEASCSNCQKTDSDIYHLSKEKMKSIIMNQMKEGFGITNEDDSRRSQSSKELSNFYLNRNGEVFFRPEEVISWIIDYIHYVEPYCGDCHSKIGGDTHLEVRNNSKTNSIEEQKPESYSNLETAETDDNHKLDTKDNTSSVQFEVNSETISIETDDNVDQAQWKAYRSPKPSETKEITSRIIHHLYSLGTRFDISYKSQRDGIYRVTMKRGETENGKAFDSFRCKDCGQSIENEEKHHPVPLCLREAHMDVINAIDVPTELNPILVNESENEYILSHKFLWRMESHIKNVDISAFKCTGCSSSSNKKSEEKQEFLQKTLSDVEETQITRDEVRDKLTAYNPDGNKGKHRIQCVACDSQDGRDNSIICRLSNGGRYETPDKTPTPIVKPERIGIQPNQTEARNIGVCNQHLEKLVEMVWAEDPEDAEEVKNHTRKSLLLMFSRNN